LENLDRRELYETGAIASSRRRVQVQRCGGEFKYSAFFNTLAPRTASGRQNQWVTYAGPTKPTSFDIYNRK
jgi:hypothetical protein